MVLPEHCNHTLLEGNARAKLDQSPVLRLNVFCGKELSADQRIARSINSVAAAVRNCCKTQQPAIHRVIIQRWLSVWEGARKWTLAAPGSMSVCRGDDLSSLLKVADRQVRSPVSRRSASAAARIELPRAGRSTRSWHDQFIVSRAIDSYSPNRLKHSKAVLGPRLLCGPTSTTGHLSGTRTVIALERPVPCCPLGVGRTAKTR